MSDLSKWAHRAMPLARKINAISGQLGKPHIHVWDHGKVYIASSAPVVRQTCELCGETRDVWVR